MSVPVSPRSRRDISPARSARSATSSAGISYTSPTRGGSSPSKSKFALGKKLGAFFSANSSSSSLPLRTSGGISSQDVVLGDALFNGDDGVDASAARRDASGATVEVLVTSPEGAAARLSDAPQMGEAKSLEDLLSRFKEEEKERLRTITAARSRVIRADSSTEVGVPVTA